MAVEVVAIFGPTASGKSAVAEALADILGTGVVSADALQVYRGLPVLTNQPERATELVAIRGLDEEMSVGEYAGLAHAVIDRLVQNVGIAVVAGGTGLYLRAALADLNLPPPPGEGRRAHWERIYDADRADAHAFLAEADPESAARVHENDRRRVVRALELVEAGTSLASGTDRLWDASTRRPTRIFGLDVPPDELERRIDERTDAMLARGAAGEARAALQAGVSKTAEKALGLRELVELAPDEARRQIVARTRRYASYQRKWMRRIPGIEVLDGSGRPEELARQIASAVASY